MKKILNILLILLTSVTLCACGSTKDENYYYKYYIDNKESFTSLINFALENEIAYAGKEECIVCIDYKQEKINNVYFYTNKKIDKNNINSQTNFIKNSILKELYLTSSQNYYILLLETSNKKTVFLEYCKSDCNYTDEAKEEKKGKKVKYDIRKKIDENWSLVYTSIE